MKVAVYSCRSDERRHFEEFADKFGINIVISLDRPVKQNASMAEGCVGVSVITQPVGRDLIDIWNEYGVRCISTRTVGFEHVDYVYAASKGIAVCNVSYTPHTVAEYTVMSILMSLRKIKPVLNRYVGQDYTLREIRGRELCRLTVGVVGTGRIGENVVSILSAFGCRVLACDLHEKDSVKEHACYTDFNTLLKESDIITFHTPATEETYHMVNRESISNMKDGVVIINMARGTIVDSNALIDALESRKVSAAALDVIEGESSIYYRDFKYTDTGHHEMAILASMPNVLMTPHTAFFTQEAVSDMIEYSLTSCIHIANGEEDRFLINRP